MPPKHHHSGHRARLRARFLKDPDSLEDHELLELVLFYAIPQKDTNALAHDLLHRFGSLSKTLNALPAQLQDIPGMGEISSQMFPVMLEIFRRYLREQIAREPSSAYDPTYVGRLYLSKFFGLTEEHVIAISLDRSFSIMDELEIGCGDFMSSPINNAKLSGFIHGQIPCYIVIAHNHPSGIALPSPADFQVTDFLRTFIRDNGGTLLDHLIFDGRGDFVSLGISGQMQDKNRYYYEVSQLPGNAPGELNFSFQKKPLVTKIVTKDQISEKDA